MNLCMFGAVIFARLLQFVVDGLEFRLRLLKGSTHVFDRGDLQGRSLELLGIDFSDVADPPRFSLAAFLTLDTLGPELVGIVRRWNIEGVAACLTLGPVGYA